MSERQKDIKRFIRRSLPNVLIDKTSTPAVLGQNKHKIEIGAATFAAANKN